MKKVTPYTIFMGLVLLADLGLTALATIPIFLLGLLLPLLATYLLAALLAYKNFRLVQRATPANSAWDALSRVSLTHNILTLSFTLAFLFLRATDSDSLVLPGIFCMYLTLRLAGGALLMTLLSGVGCLVEAGKAYKSRLAPAFLVGLLALAGYSYGFSIDDVSGENDAEAVIRVIQFICTFGSLSLTCFVTFLFGRVRTDIL
ncbi:MAG: hypothetical protein KC800_05840 [Candidatus Eremiobacteraeota bacterium]|nr:hypothetical protein [Candidatus Eremiobacteraeota bacterium]